MVLDYAVRKTAGCREDLHGVFYSKNGRHVVMASKSLSGRYAVCEGTRELIGEVLSVDAKDALNALYALMDQVLKKEPLSSFGVKEEDLAVFAKDVIQTQQRLLKNNYVALSEEDLLAVYKAAY